MSAVVVLLVAEWVGHRVAMGVSKMAAASAFIAMALSANALGSLYGQILLGGLALCWLGDALLLSEGQSKGFLLGIAAFLLGHVAYAVAFGVLGFQPFGVVGGGAVVVALAAPLLRWLVPNVPDDFRLPIVSYVVVISAMVTASIAAAAAGAPPIVAIGALGFAVSDVFVARQRFIAEGWVNAAIGLPLYFGSQLLLAYSVVFAAAP